jgi:hypothetical protein
MQDIFLLRWSQAGLLLCGLLLILIGAGVRTASLPSFPSLLALAFTGVAAGIAYEHKLRQRGEGEGMASLLLPIAGGMSGAFALMMSL